MASQSFCPFGDAAKVGLLQLARLRNDNGGNLNYTGVPDENFRPSRGFSEERVARNLLGEIDSLLAWRVGRRLLVGRERIALLEAVMEHKSITKAAEITGFSYKTAWDAVNAINNLLPRPAFITRTGGSHGGGAEVTDEGRRLILTFRRLEETLGRISTAIAAEGLENDQDLLFWGIDLKLSVRNALFCKVVKITRASIHIE